MKMLENKSKKTKYFKINNQLFLKIKSIISVKVRVDTSDIFSGESVDFVLYFQQLQKNEEIKLRFNKNLFRTQSTKEIKKSLNNYVVETSYREELLNTIFYIFTNKEIFNEDFKIKNFDDIISEVLLKKNETVDDIIKEVSSKTL